MAKRARTNRHDFKGGEKIYTPASPYMQNLLAYVRRFRPLTKQQEKAAYETKDYDMLVRHNIGFAIIVAKRYKHRKANMDDLVANAVQGLYVAAKKYIYSDEVKFCSYAVWWVNRYVQLALDESRTIKTPEQFGQNEKKIAKYITEYLQKFQTFPTFAEVFENTTLSRGKELSEYAYNAMRVTSYNKKASDEANSAELIDFFESDEKVEISEPEKVIEKIKAYLITKGIKPVFVDLLMQSINYRGCFDSSASGKIGLCRLSESSGIPKAEISRKFKKITELAKKDKEFGKIINELI